MYSAQFFKAFHRKHGVLLTDEPVQDGPVDKRLQQRIEHLYYAAQERPATNIPELERLMEEHPGVGTIKNFLYAAYRLTDQHDKALRLLEKTLRLHPDYAFGVINYVMFDPTRDWILRHGRKLGRSTAITDWPAHSDGNYHVTEFINFEFAAIHYLIFQNKLDEAKDRMNRLLELDVDEDKIIRLLKLYRLQAAKSFHERMGIADRNKVAPPAHPTVVFRPEFLDYESKFEELEDFILTDLDDVTEADLTAILTIPRAELINDLRGILYATLLRYKEYSDERKEVGLLDLDDETFILIGNHLLFLLGVLEAEELLNEVLDFVRIEEGCLDYFCGDFPDRYYHPTIIALAKSQPEKIGDYLLEPHNYTFDRCHVVEAFVQIAFHYPEQRTAVIEQFRRVFQTFLDDPGVHPALDTKVVNSLIHFAANLRAKELLPLIRATDARGWLDEIYAGPLAEVERIFDLPPDPSNKNPQPRTPIEYYTQVYIHRRAPSNRPAPEKWVDTPVDKLLMQQAAGLGFSPPPLKSLSSPLTVVRGDGKVGRNSPCPCGSGKKYKRCCGKR